MIDLYELIERYSLERGILGSTSDQLSYAVKRFERFLRHRPTLDDLDSEIVNRWIKNLAESGQYAPSTVRGSRDAVVSLWLYASESEIVESGPSRIRPVKVPELAPSGWTRDEIERILAAARSLPVDRYTPTGIQLRVYLPALIETAYYSGFPRADLMGLNVDEFGQQDRSEQTAPVVHIRKKTGTRMVASVPNSVYESILRIAYRVRRDGHSDWQTPLRWRQSWRSLYNWLDRIKSSAGVASDGALHQLRRSGATHVLMDGRDPSWYLNHRDPRLARKHYVDVLQLRNHVMPQKLPRDGAG